MSISSELADDPDYQEFLETMSRYCHCEYDKPCDSVLAAGPCERKQRESLDTYEDGEW